MRSRDTEKTIRELQQFLREHEDEITDEDSMHRLAITFMSQHNSRLQPKQTEPEDASDYLELAEAASSKKKRLEYLHKAVEVEPENIDVQLELLLAEHKKYGGYEETQMLLPLAILYYKQNQFDKAKDYLNRLAKVNRDTKKFMRLEAKHDGYSLRMEQGMYGYRPGTIEELVDAYLNPTYLFNATPYFSQWAYQYLRTQTASKKKKPKNEE
ncbi:hypothetical protein [Butyricicoccus sp. OF27-2pH9A]|uniref:hypothetical protein n=1 Tax=Butyricicoccus sp. OF27-2pH9A TaxID=3002517 RepID=UPI0022E445DB|nr:hypothetical protein [Butyricicoccus sp. OF27-2pH9A]